MTCAKWLEMKPDSGCGRCLAKKMTCYVLAFILFVIEFFDFISFMFQPSSIKPTDVHLNNSEVALGVLFSLISLIFTILLIVGLYKDRSSYLKAFMIYSIVFIVFITIGFFTLLFTKPSEMGFRGFFNIVFALFLHVICLLSVRAYNMQGRSYNENNQRGVI